MTENEKDYNAPGFRLVYMALAMGELQGGGDKLTDWLNLNGFANLTCCPLCRVDDFTHVENCQLGKVLLAAAAISRAALEKQRGQQ